jgi:hypothetical protein
MYVRNCGSFKSANKAWIRISQIDKLQIHRSQVRLCLQIANPNSATFAESPQI